MVNELHVGDLYWQAIIGQRKLDVVTTPERETQAEAVDDLWTALTEMPSYKRDRAIITSYVGEFRIGDLGAASTRRNVTPKGLGWFN